MNYCNLRRGGQMVPVLSDLIKDMEKHGNLTAFCPMKAGVYVLDNMLVEDLAMGNFFPTGDFHLVYQFIDDNGKKSVMISRLDLHFSYKLDILSSNIKAKV
jgi:hypothetical protein